MSARRTRDVAATSSVSPAPRARELLRPAGPQCCRDRRPDLRFRLAAHRLRDPALEHRDPFRADAQLAGHADRLWPHRAAGYRDHVRLRWPRALVHAAPAPRQPLAGDRRPDLRHYMGGRLLPYMVKLRCHTFRRMPFAASGIYG